MAITTIQNSNDLDGGLYYPHSINYPGIFTATSDEADNHYDFKYIFKIYDETGLIFEIKKAPQHNLLGVFNVSKIIKSYIDSNITPSSSKQNYSYQKEYRVTVQEWYSGALHGTETNFSKSLGGNLHYNFTDSVIPYTIENNRVGDFLTNQMPGTFKMSKGTEASWVYTNDDNRQEIDEIQYYVKYKLINGEIITYLYMLENTAGYTFNSMTTTIYSAEQSGIKIPIGFKTLESTQLMRKGYWEEDGTWVADAGSQFGIDSNVPADALRMELSVRLMFDDVIISEEYYWDLTECSNKDVTISWENSYGGIDFFNFNQVREDNITNKRKTYKHNSLDWTGNKLFNSTSNANESVYYSDKEFEFTLRTNNLNIGEIDLLKGLWFSDNIIMIIDGVQYPVIAITDKQTISHRERPEMVAYQLKLQYAKTIK